MRAIGTMHYRKLEAELYAFSDTFDNFVSHGGRPKDFVYSGYAPKNSIYRKEGKTPIMISPYGTHIVFNEISGKPRLCIVGNKPTLLPNHMPDKNQHFLVDVNSELHCVVSTEGE